MAKKDTQAQIGEDRAAIARLKEQICGLLDTHGGRIMMCYRKTNSTLGVKFNMALKGDNAQMSSKTSINFSEEKVNDFAEGKIDLKQGTFEFEGDTQSEGAQATN